MDGIKSYKAIIYTTKYVLTMIEKYESFYAYKVG